MKCLDRLEQRVIAMGGTMDRQCLPDFVNLDAPDGKLWACDDLRAIVVQGSNSQGQSWWVDACKDAHERLDYGLCDDPHPAQTAHYEGTCDPATCELCKGGAA